MKLFKLKDVPADVLSKIKFAWEDAKKIGLLAIGEGTYSTYANKLPSPIHIEEERGEIDGIQLFHVLKYKVKIPEGYYCYDTNNGKGGTFNKSLGVWISDKPLPEMKPLEYIYLTSTLKRNSTSKGN